MQDRLSEWWEKKFFRVVAYMAFALMAFVLFLFWTFPDHRVKEIAANQIEVALDHEYDVSINDMGFWRLSGMQVKGVRLEERVPTDADGIAQEMGLTVHIERISARFSPIRSLLNRGPTSNFQIDVGGSVINGTAHQSGTEQVVRLSMDRLDLRNSTLLATLLGVPLFGVLDGDVELIFDAAQGGMLTGGYVDIVGEHLTLGSTVLEPKQIPFITTLEVPTTSFGNLKLNIDINQEEGTTNLEFVEFESRGRDINLEVWGDIEMARAGGRPRVEMRLQVNEEYVTEHDLGALFNISELREGEYNNWYGFVISGSFGDINFRGSRTAAQGPGADDEPEQDGNADEGGDGDGGDEE